MYGAPRAGSSNAFNPVCNGDARISQMRAVDTPTSVGFVSGSHYTDCDNFLTLIVNGPGAPAIDIAQSSEHPTLDEQGFCRSAQFAGAFAAPANLLVATGVPIETFDLADYVGQNLTLSFWAMSPQAGRQYVTLYKGATGLPGSGPSFAAPYTLNFANTWQKITIPFSFPTSIFSTITPGGTRGVTIYFPHIVGTNFQFASNFISTWNAGASNVITGTDFQQLNGIFRVTEIAIRPGADATFPAPEFSAALERCKRYYWQSFPYGQTPAQNVGALARTGAIAYRATNAAAVAAALMVRHPAQMRVTPTVTFFNTSAANANWRNETLGADSAAGARDANFSDADATFFTNAQVAADALGDTIAIAASFDARM